MITQELLQKYPALKPAEKDLARAARALCAAFSRGRKLLLCGNGGSAADCEHISGELLKRFVRPRPLAPAVKKALVRLYRREGRCLAGKLEQGLPALPLPSLTSLATAFANDVGPAFAFAQLVNALGKKGDVLLAISTSGNAKNVAAAVQTARAKGLVTIGLTGRHGGRLKTLCDIVIRVPGRATPEIQELHVPLYHALCRMVEEKIFR
jgi:D-sedoheptulose 7-phosphate isomerase